MNDTTNIIGLAGPLGVGKTTMANALGAALTRLAFNVHVVRLSFATPLRMVCYQMCPEMGDKWLSHSQADKNALLPEHWQRLTGWLTLREMLIGVGTHCMRAGSPDVWIAAAVSMMKKEKSLHPCSSDWLWFIYDDIRFENEAAMIRSYPNGMLVHISRPGVEYSRANPSEMGVALCPDDLRHTLTTQKNLEQEAMNLLKAHPTGARLYDAASPDRKGSL
jgi:hypothetical protein